MQSPLIGCHQQMEIWIGCTHMCVPAWTQPCHSFQRSEILLVALYM